MAHVLVKRVRGSTRKTVKFTGWVVERALQLLAVWLKQWLTAPNDNW